MNPFRRRSVRLAAAVAAAALASVALAGCRYDTSIAMRAGELRNDLRVCAPEHSGVAQVHVTALRPAGARQGVIVYRGAQQPGNLNLAAYLGGVEPGQTATFTLGPVAAGQCRAFTLLNGDRAVTIDLTLTS